MLHPIEDDVLEHFADHTLRRTRKNDIFRIAKEIGFLLHDFRWLVVESPAYRIYSGEDRSVSALKHQPTGSYCLFDVGSLDEVETAFILDNEERKSPLSCEVRPGAQQEIETTKVIGWKGQSNIARDWLKRVKAEHNVPDLWVAIQQEWDVIKATGELENQPFTQDEVAQVQKHLLELNEFVAKVSFLSPEQSDRIEAKLAYVSEAVSRLERRDWLSVFMGVLLNIMFTVPEVQSAAQDIFHFAMYGIANALNITVDAAQRFLPGTS